MLLRKNDDVVVLGEGNFHVKLEEFDRLPLTDQKRKMKKSMIKV